MVEQKQSFHVECFSHDNTKITKYVSEALEVEASVTFEYQPTNFQVCLKASDFGLVSAFFTVSISKLPIFRLHYAGSNVM